jgi:hypothetical protein
MTTQEIDVYLKKCKYQRQVLEEIFPQMFKCRDSGDYGDDRYLQEQEEERFCQEGE